MNFIRSKLVLLASSLLIMTLVGGAVAPVIMGYIADTTGSMEIVFLIPLVCHGVIRGYAFSNHSVSSLAQCRINNKVKNMNYKKSPLDLFLQQRLEEDGQILRTTLDISLQKEMTCISEIQNGIKTCKEKISLYNKSIEKSNSYFYSNHGETEKCFCRQFEHLEYHGAYSNGKH